MGVPHVPSYIENSMISVDDVHTSAENLLFLLQINGFDSIESLDGSGKGIFNLHDSLDSVTLSRNDQRDIVLDYYRYNPKLTAAKLPLTIQLNQGSEVATITLRSIACFSPYKSIGPDFVGNIWQVRKFYSSPMEAVISELNRLQRIEAND